MSDKYIKEITQNIPNNELNAAYDALMNSSLNETSNYEEVPMEELNEYIEGLECQAETLRTQLAKANERVKELKKELSNKELLHVGFTNGAQIKYAKVEEGAFYPDTEGDCYIPLYMLKSHEHRIETTSFEQLRREKE